MTITVYGSPAPQGSKRFMGVHGGKGVMVESSKAVKPWREAVKHAIIKLRSEESETFMIEGPVAIEMIFTLQKPKSAPKNRKTWPDKKPDLSKLVRSTEDAITDMAVWEDDARVVSCYACKVFPGEHPDALSTPGAVIKIATAG